MIPLSYIYFFVDNFLGLDQDPRHQLHRVWCTLFHILEKLFRPLEALDLPHFKEVFSLKNIYSGDCYWSIFQLILVWLVYMFNIMLFLPPHHIALFKDIFSVILDSQNQTSIYKWHQILFKLCSMVLAFPGTRGLFIHMKEAFRNTKIKIVDITKGIRVSL